MKTLLSIALILCNTIILAQDHSILPNQIEVITEVEDGTTTLKWNTNREVNTSYFLIEKSEDGEHFEILSTAKAGGSTYQNTTYEFEDTEEVNSYSTYRITTVLMDGSIISSLSETNQNVNLTQFIAE